jgi:hypothetical protein
VNDVANIMAGRTSNVVISTQELNTPSDLTGIMHVLVALAITNTWILTLWRKSISFLNG